MDHDFKSWRCKSNLKETIIGCYSFSIWETISITQTSPLAIEFNACVVMPCGDLENQCYIYTRAEIIHICVQTPPTFNSKSSYEGGCSPWDVMHGT
jgi:hypothetical protein